jgi:putative transposase
MRYPGTTSAYPAGTSRVSRTRSKQSPARDNRSSWGYRRIHGELLILGIKVAASTVWEILHEAGIDPAPERTSTTWATFFRSQAEAILAADFFETVTLTGTRMYAFAVVEYAPAVSVTVIRVVLAGVQIPRMNSVMKRWIQTCRRELLDRTLIWNQRHLLHALHQYEGHIKRTARGCPASHTWRSRTWRSSMTWRGLPSAGR